MINNCVKLLDLVCKTVNLFVPALLLYFVIVYVFLERKKIHRIINLGIIEILSIIYYIFEIKTEFWGLYKPLLIAEVLIMVFMLVLNNAIYIVLMARTNMDKYRPFQKLFFILIAPIITIIFYMIWLFVQSIIF